MVMLTKIHAPNITCEGCANTIRRALGELPGVSQVEVDVPAKSIQVRHEPPADRDALTGTLDRIGYPENGTAAETHTRPPRQRADASPSAQVLDVVCGMRIDPNTAAGKSEYHSQTYYFCSTHCRHKFEADPERYLNSSSEAAAPPLSPDAIYICPMHPEVRQVGPGTCPKCGMA